MNAYHPTLGSIPTANSQMRQKTMAFNEIDIEHTYVPKRMGWCVGGKGILPHPNRQFIFFNVLFNLMYTQKAWYGELKENDKEEGKTYQIFAMEISDMETPLICLSLDTAMHAYNQTWISIPFGWALFVKCSLYLIADKIISN